VFGCQDKSKGVFNADYRNNPHLVLAVFASVAIIFTAMLSGLLSPLLQTVPLDRSTILLVVAFAAGLPMLKGIGKLVQ
jgi:hypothetical protein